MGLPPGSTRTTGTYAEWSTYPSAELGPPNGTFLAPGNTARPSHFATGREERKRDRARRSVDAVVSACVTSRRRCVCSCAGRCAFFMASSAGIIDSAEERNERVTALPSVSLRAECPSDSLATESWARSVAVPSFFALGGVALQSRHAAAEAAFLLGGSFHAGATIIGRDLEKKASLPGSLPPPLRSPRASRCPSWAARVRARLLR